MPHRFNDQHGTPARQRGLLDALLASARSLIVVTDPQGRVVRFNRACEDLTGRREADVQGHYAWELLLSAHSKASTRAFFHAPHTLNFPFTGETSLLDRDGRKRVIAWTSSTLQGEHGQVEFILAQGTDITRQHHLAHDLRSATSREERLREYHDLLELAQDAIAVLTPDRVIRYWNPAAERLYGWTRQEARGQVMHELLHTQFPLPRSAVDAALHRTGQWEGQLRHRTKEGREVTVTSKLALRRNDAGESISILEVNNDISALQHAAVEREALLAQLGAQRAHFEAVLQQMPIGVLIADGQTGRVTFANQRCEQLLGVELQPGLPAAVIQRTLRQADGQPLEGGMGFLQALRDGLSVKDQDLHVRRPDGQRVRVWASASPVRNRLGALMSYVLTLEEVEDRWQHALAAVAPPDPEPVTPEVFVRRFGRTHAALGHPPLEGRLLALLLLSEQPISLTEAVRRLHATKGALSKVVGEMHARGDLQVTRHPSTREHFLSLANQVYLRDLMEKRDVSAALAALGYALLRDNPDLAADVRWRVRDLADVRAQHALNISRLLEVRHQAQERARETHLQEDWDAVPPKNNHEDAGR